MAEFMDDDRTQRFAFVSSASCNRLGFNLTTLPLLLCVPKVTDRAQLGFQNNMRTHFDSKWQSPHPHLKKTWIVECST